MINNTEKKNTGKLKLTLLSTAILLPTAFSIICTKMHFEPANSTDREVFGTQLLPANLAAIPGIQLFEIALICTMVVITAILTGIALTRRMSNK